MRCSTELRICPLLAAYRDLRGRAMLAPTRTCGSLAPAQLMHLRIVGAIRACEPVPLAAFAPLAPAALSELRPDVSTTRPNGRSARHDTTRKRFPATLATLKISHAKVKPLRGGLRPDLTLLVTAVRKLAAAMTHMGQPLLLPRSEWQK